ncbi:MAG: M23 family metallopeptidase [Myxococcota bacterium]
MGRREPDEPNYRGRGTILMLVVLLCSSSASSSPKESRTLAVREAIRAGLEIDARVRLVSGHRETPGLSAEQLRATVADNDESILDCALFATRRAGPIDTSIRARIQVSADGVVDEFSFVGEPPEELAACLAQKLRAASFPSGIGPTQGTLRLDFDSSQVVPAIAAAFQDAQRERDEHSSHFIDVLWPVANTKVTSGFGRRPDPFGAQYKFHGGVDLRAKMGQEVMAVAAGRIHYAGWRTLRGKEVVVEHRDGFQSGYGHLSKIVVRPGQWVSAGDVLGEAGTTGVSTWPHLHFEITVNGKRIDPIKVLGKRIDVRALTKTKTGKKKKRKARARPAP